MLICGALSPEVYAQATVTYVHTDALGTPVAESDASGNLIAESFYDPYGSMLVAGSDDQPGFTGQVSDAQTGLNYMQQRYYEPALGIFLSVDPVTAYGDPESQFNRYRYANNNPYKFIDPDGRVVNYAYINGVTRHTGRMHMAEVAMSQLARGELRQLEESPHLYTIAISGTGLPSYNPNNRTVYLNPNIAILTKKGVIQSSAINSSHEISHAAQDDRSGSKRLTKDLLEVDANGVSREENRANAFEKQVGEELELPTRENYKDVERVIDCKKTPMTGC
jgi:RHS repeat-associated protein